MPYDRPIVLSIGGFDPCGGAGVLADVKTFEQHRCLGMAVATAMTQQVEDRFISVRWLSLLEITKAVRSLTKKYKINFVKIGLIENPDVLFALIIYLKRYNKHVKIIWDPVMAASSGFKLMGAPDRLKLVKILRKVFLITPNIPEIISLTGVELDWLAANYMVNYCSVLLKGGHSETEKGVDRLVRRGVPMEKIQAGQASNLPPKHGSGCILSAAITCCLAKGQNLETACKNAKYYIETTLASNPHLLAYHVS